MDTASPIGNSLQSQLAHLQQLAALQPPDYATRRQWLAGLASIVDGTPARLDRCLAGRFWLPQRSGNPAG